MSVKDLSTLKLGDKIKITCEDRTLISGTGTVTMKGQIIEIFDACTPEKSCWEIKIRDSRGSWFYYRQDVDGGVVDLISEN